MSGSVDQILDESADRQIVHTLRQAGSEVECIAKIAPGADDPDVLARANRQSLMPITVPQRRRFLNSSGLNPASLAIAPIV
jgi:hypothetical protein